MDNNADLLEVLQRIASSLEKILLLGKAKDKYFIRRKLTSRIKVRIRKRDGNKCVRCGFPDKLTVHHIIPISEAASHGEEKISSDDNLVTLCERCHTNVHLVFDLEKPRFFKYIKHIKNKIKISEKFKDEPIIR
jgi:5-methylcytosine-specific restriction endonuclease McrA